MAGHLNIGSVEPGIVTIGVGHGGLEIVADHELRHAAEIPEQVGMHADPVGQALAWASLRRGGARCSIEPDGLKCHLDSPHR